MVGKTTIRWNEAGGVWEAYRSDGHMIWYHSDVDALKSAVRDLEERRGWPSEEIVVLERETAPAAPPSEWAELGVRFEDAVRVIRENIDVYGYVMQDISQLKGVPESVSAHARMAMETAQRAAKQWNAVADDWFVMNDKIERGR